MRFALLAILLAACTPLAAQSFDRSFELKKGDHVCLIGNALAERMQHFGWLETYLYARYPQHELVFRNLGYGGDEVNGYRRLYSRMRSMDFGSQDQWLAGEAPIPQPNKLNKDAPVSPNRFRLTNTHADVVFVFYGYNESFAGEPGLQQFRADLDGFLKHALAQKYNGKSPPRLVLFSPIAHEDLGDPNLPDGEENNKRLALYTRAMADVARADGARFVDLFHPTRALFAGRSGGRFTINGIHLNEQGDRAVARIAYAALFGNAPTFDASFVEKLRTAVNEKNELWFRRYRATDGYSTYGDRAFLRFVNGQTNYEVVQRELEVIDLLVANRDKTVWAAAQGKTSLPDDSNLPPFIPVISNKPGPLPGGKHVFLGGEEEIGKMTVHKGMKVNLFASEEKFPELVNPVQMAFDTRGRLWVAAWHTYPHWKPTEPMDDKLLILEDNDGDGRADRCVTFAGDLHNPTGFEFWGGGVIVAQGPDILFLKDTDGDDRYDVKERMLHGLDTADTHHTANSFVLDPGGALYFQEGTFHHTQVETPWGPPRRNANAGVYRFEPRTRKFDVYVTFPFANPHGHAFDRWGQDIVVDGTGAVPYHAPLFSSRLEFPEKHRQPPTVYRQRTRPCPGIEFLSSPHFPDELQGNLLVANVIGFQGILQYKMRDLDSSLSATEVEPIVSSSDPNFRPADLEIAPDGSLYFTDWHNPIIGHMQHNLRDPNRDRVHGRVYRVMYPGRPLVKPAAIAGESIDALLARLEDPEDRVRSRARIELSARDTKQVIAAARRWLADLDRRTNDPARAHHELEALWLFQSHNVVDLELLTRVLHSPADKARAAAVRVCAAWQDRLPNVLDLLRPCAEDRSPLVRLMAVWAASFIPRAEAAEVVLLAQEHPGDRYIDFLAKEVMRTLGPLLEKARAKNRTVAFKTETGARFLLRHLNEEELFKRKGDRLIDLEILRRPGIAPERRLQAIADLADRERTTRSNVIANAIDALDRSPLTFDAGVAADLVKLIGATAPGPPDREALLAPLARRGKNPLLRQLALAALLETPNSIDREWSLAVSSPTGLLDLIEAVSLIAEPSVRAALYPRIDGLLDGMPASLNGTANAAAIRHAAMRALAQFRGQEAKTFQRLAQFVRRDDDRIDAVRALRLIPRAAWPADQAPPLLRQLLDLLRPMSVRQRTRPAATDLMEFCDSLSTLLPASEAKSVRAELRALGVRVIRVGTVFERMTYDKDVIAVEAGKPVQFAFENGDLMPHNFVIVSPGALEEIGMLSEARAQQPGFAARQFVPESPKILLSSTLLQPRETQRLIFTAPKTPGVYPYVCTYPGHWRRMYGALYVVADLDEYLADPQKYVARARLEPRDPLLADRRPRVEWTAADLARPVAEMTRSGGRNFGNGKQMFAVASCVACHRLEGTGNLFGPDLTKIDPKWKPSDILGEILNPSARINEKFQTNVFELASGKTVSGLVVEETADVVKIVENPLAKTELTVLRRGDILDRQRSKTSIMPKGLLDKLTRDEVLDLVAYVAAGGNKQHPLFGAQGHGHMHAADHSAAGP